jgi:hypothetical protein
LADSAVENDTDTTILVSSETWWCDTPPGKVPDASWRRVRPGDSATLSVLKIDLIGTPCALLLKSERADSFAIRLDAGRRYSVTIVNGTLSARDTGEYDGWELSALVGWLVHATAFTFAFGGLIALLGTVRYFYRYYVKHQG